MMENHVEKRIEKSCKPWFISGFHIGVYREQGFNN